MSARLVRGMLRRWSETKPADDEKPEITVYAGRMIHQGTYVGLFEHENTLELQGDNTMLVELDKIIAIEFDWNPA